MPTSSLPPEEQPRVKPFDPLVLDKTVIAIPLLEQMREDFARIDEMLKDHPDASGFNTAIQYNEAFPGGLDGAWQAVQGIATEAATKTLTVIDKQMSQVATSVQPRFERRRNSLQRAVATPNIPPPLSGHSYGFASLDAGVARRVTAANNVWTCPRSFRSAPRGSRSSST